MSVWKNTKTPNAFSHRSTSMSAIACLWCLWCRRFPLCLHYHLLFPMLSFSFKFNNLPAVCFSRDSLAPLAHRRTAESVGNLTQHKLHCETEVSECVGSI